jgi:membrane protease YdiL (CAAX protease family)
VFGILTAGFVEEVLYRGYAIERVAYLTGSHWIGGAFSIAVFALVHLPFWGAGILFSSAFAGTVFTLLYVWLRNLWPCIIAHTLLDAIALIALQPH